MQASLILFTMTIISLAYSIWWQWWLCQKWGGIDGLPLSLCPRYIPVLFRFQLQFHLTAVLHTKLYTGDKVRGEL